MHRAQPQRLPNLADISSREGVRGAVRSLYEYLHGFFESDYAWKNSAANESNPLYGELDYTPAEIAAGAQAVVTVTVPNAILGYCVEVSYDQDLEALQMTAYVSADDTVKVILKNDTGAPVTLSAGRFRAYVWPRELSE